MSTESSSLPAADMPRRDAGPRLSSRTHRRPSTCRRSWWSRWPPSSPRSGSRAPSLVDADQENGLRRPSVAMVFQLTVVDRW